LLILRHDPALKGLFALNKFDIREIATRNMPWRKITPGADFLKDSDDSALRHYLEKRYSIRNRQIVQDALAINIEQNAFHPVKEYLSKLTWDNTSRIDTLLIDYLGAEDSTYTRSVIRKVMVAAVKRIYQPGAKFDYVLTLVGHQGAGKSTFVKKIGMDWYSDSFGTIQGKEAYEIDRNCKFRYLLQRYVCSLRPRQMSIYTVLRLSKFPSDFGVWKDLI